MTIWNRHISVAETHLNSFVSKHESQREGRFGVFANDTARNNFIEWMKECGVNLIAKPEIKLIATERFKIANEDKYASVDIAFNANHNRPGIIVNIPQLAHIPPKNGGEPMSMPELMNRIQDKLKLKYGAHAGGSRRIRKTRRTRRIRKTRRTLHNRK